MILFIASIVVAASVVGVFTDSISQVSEAIDQRGISASENIRTDIEIISDSGSDNVYRENLGKDDSGQAVVIHVKNTGSETLTAESDQIDVFLDGEYQTDVNVTLLGGATSWRPGEVAEVNVTTSINSGDHRVKVIINEDEEVFRFNT